MDKIYEEIITRFPIGRLASYILNNEFIDKDYVIKEMEYFTQGLDSDRRYADEKSKEDARRFLERLKLE